MNTLENVKQWFIDRDLENGGRLDKQSLKLSEEFGELCAGYLKKNEKVTKDSIGDCAVVIVGLALLIKEDVNQIFEESDSIRKKDVMESFISINANISEFQLSQGFASKELCRHNLVRCIGYLKNLGYDFDECFELAYQEIKDRKGKWIDGSFVKEEDLPDDTKISSGTVVDKYIDEPHTVFIPVMTGESSVLVPTRTKRRYILVVSGNVGIKNVEETFEVTVNEYKRYEIGNIFIQDSVLENMEGDEQ